MTPFTKAVLNRRIANENIWLSRKSVGAGSLANNAKYTYRVLETEDAVGQAMLAELMAYGKERNNDIVIVLLGGRGAQAMYKHIARLAKGPDIDELLSRLHVFTQDALAPMKMNSGLSFIRDFERLLGPEFFNKVKSFTPMNTETDDLEGELVQYLNKIESLGGIDLFFLGLGPEAEGASHVCYIRPNSGATADDAAGIIPISSNILDHHISKFKAGGSTITAEDEDECRKAEKILTLGPATILGSRRIIQSIVDASTAPAKRESFRRLTETELSTDPDEAARQADKNPGLWVRFHPDVRTFVLPDLLDSSLELV